MSKANKSSPWRKVGDGICPITLAGQSLFLLPERAVYWADRKLLFVADLHLGKDATFRQAGLAVPAASSRDSLNRLQNLIEIFEPAECIILGDLIHAADSLNERVHAEISEFFLRVPQCRWRLIKGNHDRHTKKWPEHWPLMIEGEGNCEGPFRLMHIPPSAGESQAVSKPGRLLAKAWQSESDVLFLAGHIHPAWRLPGSMLVREKLACFWLTPRGLILPAFGTFTGTRVIERIAQDRIFVIADTKVLECG